MKTGLLMRVLAMALVLGGCGDEPDRIVSAKTADGRWELTLEARKNSLRPEETLAVRVTLESLEGQPMETFRDTIDLLSNAGSVSPTRLVFTFVGSQDTTYTGQGNTTTFGDWVTYTMARKGSRGSLGACSNISSSISSID